MTKITPEVERRLRETFRYDPEMGAIYYRRIPQETRPGYCRCGCGKKTKLYPRNNTSRGRVKGKPAKFLPFHQNQSPRNTNGRADTTIDDGYRSIGANWAPRRAHRVAWFLYYGRWPVVCIDHINGDRADNRLVNLREATVAENNRNSAGNPGLRQSKYKGVRHVRNDWVSVIFVGDRCRCIGHFTSEEEAARAYDDEAQKVFGQFASLNFPNTSHMEQP